ncbi:uncharacterized protein LOC132043727 [Lycium ferocissimum]|uniref:uncharacterized protein LOC132043727 n=1 Tax=Lycium ferocissimum TaxID=112874 RepID=UPI0028164F0B|nr:uncharacterized protein LOC132043727 [Lycium ferocissimum]
MVRSTKGPLCRQDANYVNNSQGGYQRQNYQGGYQSQNQWRPQQGQGAYNNSGNYNNNYGGASQGSYNNKNKILGTRVPILIYHRKGNQQQGSSKVESMPEDSRANRSSPRELYPSTEKVGAHTTAIQKLESQIRDISREQHPPKKGGLPSDTIPNPKNGGSGVDRVFSIPTSKGGKILQGVKDEKVIDLEPIDEEDERLVKKKEDAKFEKFYDQLKQLSLNFPFLEAVKEMPGFAKYLKDLLTKKKMVQHETVSLTYTVSSIISTTTVQKKGDPGAFTIPCYVGHHDFARLGMPRPTTMRLQMADRSIKRSVRVVDDVLVPVGDFMLPTDFVILDCAVDRDIPIILGRPFFAHRRAAMDSEKNEIKFRVNDEEVTFQASKGIKLPSADESISLIDWVDVIDEAFKMEEKSLGEALVFSLILMRGHGRLCGDKNTCWLGSYSYQPKKPNLDAENRTTPPKKPSIIEPPKLELKQLPSHLKYEVLGPENTLPVIVSALLTEEKILQLLEVLREYRRAIGWTIAI